MFDIGFWELCLITLVSLLVIGPERLPKAARIAGFWVGKARQTMAAVKIEIHQELQAEEMRQILKEQQDDLQTVMDETANISKTTQDSLMERASINPKKL
ncbi:MAG: twin-arginine translocase subunit TatB [Methylococcales bacterium]|nr:twin-arginine translocase subunit TatB [Methylococcales bacterium]